MLRSKDFWVGALLGYLLVVFFPAVNVRTRMGR